MPRLKVPDVGPHSSATILLGDDDATVRRLARTMLSRQGNRVSEASDAPEALQVLRFKGHEVELLVTDVNVPGMSGPALAEAAVADGYCMPVLYMTGSPDHPSLEAVRSRGDFAIVTKPFTGRMLFDAVVNVLNGPRRPRVRPVRRHRGTSERSDTGRQRDQA